MINEKPQKVVRRQIDLADLLAAPIMVGAGGMQMNDASALGKSAVVKVASREMANEKIKRMRSTPVPNVPPINFAGNKTHETLFALVMHSGTPAVDELDQILTNAKHAGKPYDLMILELTDNRRAGAYGIETSTALNRQSHHVDLLIQGDKMTRQDASRLLGELDRASIEIALGAQLSDDEILARVSPSNTCMRLTRKEIIDSARGNGEVFYKGRFYDAEGKIDMIKVFWDAILAMGLKHNLRIANAEEPKDDRQRRQLERLNNPALAETIWKGFVQAVPLLNIERMVAAQKADDYKRDQIRNSLVLEQAPKVQEKIRADLGKDRLRTMIVYGKEHSPIAESASSSWQDHEVVVHTSSCCPFNQIGGYQDADKFLLWIIVSNSLRVVNTDSKDPQMDGKRVFEGVDEDRLFDKVKNLGRADFERIAKVAEGTGSIVRSAIVLAHLVGTDGFHLNISRQQKEEQLRALEKTRSTRNVPPEVLRLFTENH